MSSDYVAQREALVNLSVAYEGARDFTRQVLCTAFGNVALGSVPPPSECVWPPDVPKAEANSRLRAVQHFLGQAEAVFKKVLRDIEAARLRLVSSGFDVPRSWIIIDPLSSIRGWYLGACGVEEVVRNAASEDAALQTVVEDIAKDTEVFLKCKIANAYAADGERRLWADAIEGEEDKSKGNDATTASSQKPYLGIHVDDEHHELKRDGFPNATKFGPTEWHIVKAAFRAGERGATKSEWQNGYPGQFVGDGPRQRKSAIRDKLRPMNLTLEGGEGVRIIEIDVKT